MALLIPGIEDLQVVGRGGFATVYRGWQPAFARWVAVKLLRSPTEPADGSPADRFRQEARAVGSMSEHPHVVPVYEAGQIDGRPYLVMPYLTGGSLQQRIATRPLTPAEAVSTGRAIADALAEAHRIGILHRDVKPANVLFTAYGVPQLGDFGVARVSDSSLTGGVLAATVPYAAPEVLSGQGPTALSDVYSLGATLYAALRGTPPFAAREGEAAVARAMRVVGDSPAPLEDFGVPGPLAALVARAMAKDPAARFSGAAEMRDALAGTGPTARWGPPAGPVGTSALGDEDDPRDPDKPARGRELRPVLAAAVAVLALAGAGTAAAVAVGGGHHPAARAGASSGHHAGTAGVSAPSSRPVPTPPSTARNSASATAGPLPPSAGGATTPAQIPPPVLADTLRAYYALVAQHRLDQSWTWLSPAFQNRVGPAYYRQFWDTISDVQVLSVQPVAGAARITLRYVAADGATSVETDNLGFTIGAGNRVLIDTYQG